MYKLQNMKKAPNCYRLSTDPDPMMFFVTIGSPVYLIEPEPATVTSNLSLAFTSASPLPAILTVVALVFKFSPR